ncbi:MAG TPA: DUF4230 domain-containing protein [Polyangia bacterium]
MNGMRRILLIVVAVLVLGLGLGLGVRFLGRSARRLPDPAAVSVQIREIARLETLEVSLYKKVTFSPAPSPADSFWGDVMGWARHVFATPAGKAIVFADVRLGLDLDKLGPGNIKAIGQTVFLVLPPIKVTVELKPGETEIIGSNLDSSETAQLLDLAKTAFEREVTSSPNLRQRARASAERAITSFLVVLGFTDVRFVDVLPSAGGAS